MVKLPRTPEAEPRAAKGTYLPEQERPLTAKTDAPPPAAPRPPALEPEHIDQLMAAPIPERPKITVLGDDAVTGINPPPTRP